MAGIFSTFLTLSKLVLLLLFLHPNIPAPVTATPPRLRTGQSTTGSQQPAHRKRPPTLQPLLLGKETKAPWNAALFNNQTKAFLCGGSLIKPSVVLTAAHCILDNVDYVVLLGAASGHYEEAVVSSSVQAARVPRDKIYKHEDYLGRHQNDIALMFLDTPIILNDKVQLVKLPTNVQMDLVDTTSVTLQLAGLGVTVESKVSHTLNGMDVITFDCTRLSSIVEVDENIALCAAPKNFKQAVCRGDSGGGLTLTDKETSFIIGITSHGLHEIENVQGCNKNGVFTKVAAFTDWIVQILDKVLPPAPQLQVQVQQSSTPLPRDFVSVQDFQRIQAELLALQEQVKGQSITKTATTLKPVVKSTLQSCSEIQKLGAGAKNNNRQKIFPYGNDKPGVNVLCDFQTEGGGWTTIQKRSSSGPKKEFDRTWTEYENGFGSIDGNYWLGLKTIYALTKDGDQELRIDLWDFEGGHTHVKYSNFSISDSSDDYRLSIRGFAGAAGGGMTRDQSWDNLDEMRFSTKDRDNDEWEKGNCAAGYKAGWWYNACMGSHLNGHYYEKIEKPDPSASALFWNHWISSLKSLRQLEMKIRRRSR